MESDQEETKQQVKKTKNENKKGAKKNNNLEYNLFLQDLEEDPELRSKVNLYRDDDIMADLEKRMAGMNINSEKSIAIK